MSQKELKAVIADLAEKPGKADEKEEDEDIRLRISDIETVIDQGQHEDIEMTNDDSINSKTDTK